MKICSQHTVLFIHFRISICFKKENSSNHSIQLYITYTVHNLLYLLLCLSYFLFLTRSFPSFFHKQNDRLFYLTQRFLRNWLCCWRQVFFCHYQYYFCSLNQKTKQTSTKLRTTTEFSSTTKLLVYNITFVCGVRLCTWGSTNTNLFC